MSVRAAAFLFFSLFWVSADGSPHDIDSQRAARDEANATVIRAYLKAGDRMDAQALGALWAEDGVMEYPFSPEELTSIPRRIEGGKAIEQWYESMYSAPGLAPSGQTWIRQTIDSLLPLSEPDLFLLEYHERSTTGNGKVFESSYCAIIRLHEGKIVHWREYFDSKKILAIFGEVSADEE